MNIKRGKFIDTGIGGVLFVEDPKGPIEVVDPPVRAHDGKKLRGIYIDEYGQWSKDMPTAGRVMRFEREQTGVSLFTSPEGYILGYDPINQDDDTTKDTSK
jgi:hypothetical protein